MNRPAAPTLREQYDALVADTSVGGVAFGAALADLLDDTLRVSGAGADDLAIAVVALGSYARRELCPYSDVDALVLVGGRRAAGGDTRVRDLAEQIWYPLWDAGFVTGHGARSVKESITLADGDIEVLTSLLDPRLVIGDRALCDELRTRSRDLAIRRRERLLRSLAASTATRRDIPGPIADMLEPDIKGGAGGLRDIQSLVWAGDTFGEEGGIPRLAARGFLTGDDVVRLEAARVALLTVRVALHRTAMHRGDRLLLQEQDGVARLIGYQDADVLVRAVADSARAVAWIASEAWSRLLDFCSGPAGRASRDRRLGERIMLRDGRVAIVGDDPLRAIDVLEAASAAADAGVGFDRASLGRLRQMSAPGWNASERAAFIRLLRAGDRAVPVLEALAHEGVLLAFLPEWEHVRSLPQRNAYHRFTVDRHSLEAVRQCARLLDAAVSTPSTFDGAVARECRRPELLLLAALLHDVGKGADGDHSIVGAETTDRVAERIGLDHDGRDILTWLVREHLLLARVATRRDLSDASVVEGVAANCSHDPERLRLLYLLTVGDSLATGPAAWGTTKAALVRDLFVKVATALDRGAAVALAEERRRALTKRVGQAATDSFLATMPQPYVLAYDDATMAQHLELLTGSDTKIVLDGDAAGGITVTVATSDRPGLLSTLAGALTCAGLELLDASVYVTSDGMALDVFSAADPYQRFEREGADGLTDRIEAALAGDLDVVAGVAARVRDYRRPDRKPGPVSVVVDNDASDNATVIEVHADDDVGLLCRLAAAFAALQFDVTRAKAATMADRVVDVFYVRDANGGKLVEPDVIERVRSTLTATAIDA